MIELSLQQLDLPLAALSTNTAQLPCLWKAGIYKQQVLSWRKSVAWLSDAALARLGRTIPILSRNLAGERQTGPSRASARSLLEVTPAPAITTHFVSNHQVGYYFQSLPIGKPSFFPLANCRIWAHLSKASYKGFTEGMILRLTFTEMPLYHLTWLHI